MNIADLPKLDYDHSHIFIQVIDADSGLAIHEIYCGGFSSEAVERAIKADPGSLLSPNPVYIDDSDIAILKSIIAINPNDEKTISSESESDDRDLVIVAWKPGNGRLPYRLHTGRELILMEENQKPLSTFVGRIPPDDSFIEIPEHLFDHYVKDGTLHKREIREMEDRPVRGIEGHRVVLYARAGEEWRLDAYALVRSLGKKIGWSEPLIRLEGTLLGYQEWENDAYIAQMKAKAST